MVEGLRGFGGLQGLELAVPSPCLNRREVGRGSLPLQCGA